MSSDFLYDVEDENKNVVLLTMRASGFAELTLMDDDKDGEIEGNIVSFGLTPDEFGWENAESIISALTEWVSHTKRISQDLSEPSV